MTALLHSDRRLAAFYFAYYAALGGFSPYFSPFLESRGFSAWQIGVVMALWFGTRVLAPPLWAGVVATSTHPLRWLQAGAMATLLGFALYLLPLGFVGVVLVMLVFASFYNAILPQFEALTLAQLGHRQSSYGRIRVFGSIGFLVANLAFGALMSAVGYGWLVLSLLPVFAALYWSSRVQLSPAAAAPTESDTAPAPTALPLRSLSLWLFLCAALAMQIAHGPFYVFFSLYLGEYGYSPTLIGIYWASGVLAEIGMFLIMAKVLRRMDARTVMLACFAVGAARWLLTANLPNWPLVLLLAQFGHAFTFAAFHSASMQIISRLFPGRSAVQGQGLLFGFSSGLGGVLGALLAGALWEWRGGYAAFSASALVSVMGLLLVCYLPRNPRSKP